MRACWCGNRTLDAFSDEYARCPECGGLVFLGDLAEPVGLDDSGFYGHAYWDERQTALGHPPMEARARSDLIERNLHWLQALLTYRSPPARILEVGCGHGSFVALLRAAGYQASGLDLSPWVVEFARATFGIPVVQGRVSQQNFEPESFDCIVMMDVLEHLPDPAAELQDYLRLLTPDGLLVIQTPRYSGEPYHDLVEGGSPFLKMLLPVEHVHLFSEASIRRLLHDQGIGFVSFELALFPYDMFVFAARSPLQKTAFAAAAATLASAPERRPVLGLLDLYMRYQQLEARYLEAEADRRSRLSQVNELVEILNQSEEDRAARLLRINELTDLLQISEADRAARLEQIHELASLLQASEADRAVRLEQIHELNRLFQIADADRTDRLNQVKELTAMLQAAEADRTARFEQIQELTEIIHHIEANSRVETGEPDDADRD